MPLGLQILRFLNSYKMNICVCTSLTSSTSKARGSSNLHIASTAPQWMMREVIHCDVHLGRPTCRRFCGTSAHVTINL